MKDGNLPACPVCRLPLVRPAAQVTAMACPRCNTWLDIDPLCSGSCMACHKMHEQNPLACVQEAVQKSHPVVVKRK